MYILITKNAKILLTPEELKDFMQRMNSGATLLACKGHFVNKHLLEIFEFEYYVKQEADQLKQKGQRRCRKCGDILDRSDICPCKDNPKLRKENIYYLDNKNMLDKPKIKL